MLLSSKPMLRKCIAKVTFNLWMQHAVPIMITCFEFIMLLNTLQGKNGEVNIPGFYDPIPDLSEEEKGLYVDITAALVQRNPDLGEPAALATSLMRRWREAPQSSRRLLGFET